MHERPRTLIKMPFPPVTRLVMPQRGHRSPASSLQRPVTPVSRKTLPTAVFSALEDKYRRTGDALETDRSEPTARPTLRERDNTEDRSPRNRIRAQNRHATRSLSYRKKTQLRRRCVASRARAGQCILAKRNSGRTANEVCTRKEAEDPRHTFCCAKADAREAEGRTLLEEKEQACSGRC